MRGMQRRIDSGSWGDWWVDPPPHEVYLYALHCIVLRLESAVGPTVVLAYSGGLDTSAIVPWLRETYDATVICYTGDVGQGDEELRGLREKAIASGAKDCIIRDLREEFVRDVVFPVLRAGAIYQDAYLLGTAMARPIVAAEQVAVAREVGASGVAHGCTGKGNDQVRFELTFQVLGPELDVIAPWREWDLRGRADLLEYLEARNIPTTATLAKPFSRDRNLWHCSHEGGVLEDPGQAPPEDMFVLTADPASAPDQPQTVEIGFEAGNPVSLNGQELGPAELVQALNEVGGVHGIGRVDLVEDRLVGIKSRGVYETPGGTILYQAHRDLERLVLNRRTQSLKALLADHYAMLVYDGLWWTPEREAIDAFVTETQRVVTGTVRLELLKGSARVISRESPYGRYRSDLATFDADEVYRQSDATGFIRLFGLGTQRSPQLAEPPRRRLIAV